MAKLKMLHKIAPTGSDKPLCLHALELEPKNGSYGLMIGRDNEKRLMVRHTEEGRPIIKGDRLVIKVTKKEMEYFHLKSIFDAFILHACY